MRASVADTIELLRHFDRLLGQRGVRFFVAEAPLLVDGPALTPTERSLLAAPFGPSGRAGRVDWLRGCPPHLAALYADLPGFSRAVAHELFHPVGGAVTSHGRVSAAHRSTHVNVSAGMRHTTDQPAVYDRCLFVLGDSGVFGFGCDDRHTLPSHLQRMVIDRAADLGARLAVFNLAARGPHAFGNFLTLANLGCREGDVVVMGDQPREAIDALIAAGDPLAGRCTRADFSARAPGREIFIDAGHVAHEGQRMLAERILDALLADRGPSATRSAPASGTPPAGGALSRLAAFEATCSRRFAAALDSPAFEDFLRGLPCGPADRSAGALVLNANPFTLGHRHLVEYAATRVARLHLFVVEEDRSEFDFATRIALVREGTAHLPGVSVHPSGTFILSAATLPEYFAKDASPDVAIDATRDLTLFAEKVAPLLGVGVRFVAEEPRCAVTRQHNRQMRSLLPRYGIRVEEIPRFEIDGRPVSASRVREALREGDLDAATRLVPPTTAAVLRRRFSSR